VRAGWSANLEDILKRNNLRIPRQRPPNIYRALVEASLQIGGTKTRAPPIMPETLVALSPDDLFMTILDDSSCRTGSEDEGRLSGGRTKTIATARYWKLFRSATIPGTNRQKIPLWKMGANRKKKRESHVVLTLRGEARS